MSMFSRSLILILCIDLMLIMTQVAALQINPDANIRFQVNSSTTEQGYQALLTTNNTDELMPTSSGANNQISTGGIFIQLITDPFSTIKSWWASLKNKFAYVEKILNAVPTFLRGIKILPEEFVAPISGLWYLLNVVIIAGYWVGRD